jgi:hypothetical protein
LYNLDTCKERPPVKLNSVRVTNHEREKKTHRNKSWIVGIRWRTLPRVLPRVSQVARESQDYVRVDLKEVDN